jgi:hypothetical protein
LLTDHDVLLVEAAPGQNLSTLARRHPAVRQGRSRVTAVLPAIPAGDDADRRALDEALTLVRAAAVPEGVTS